MSVIQLTESNFNEEVIESPVPVLVDFWASWCGPCRMMAPVVDEIAEDAQTLGIKVGKINVDDEPDLAAKYNVMSIPTLMVFRNGEVSNSSVGVQPKQALLDMIANAAEAK
jgi:thioredoxin 1